MIPWEKLARLETKPLRIRLLEIYDGASEPLSPKQVAVLTEESLSDVSYHVRKLTEWGFLVTAGTRPVRGATQHFYRRAIED